MFKNLKYREKTLYTILGISSLIYVVIFAFFFVRFKDESRSNAIKYVDEVASAYSNRITAELQVDVGISRALAYSFLGYRSIKQSERWRIYKSMLQEVIKKTPDYVSVWASYEYSAFDSTYKKSYGRKSFTALRMDGRYDFTDLDKNMDGDIVGSNYHSIKQAKREWIDEPYFYSLTQDGKNEVLLTSICVPILENGNYIGLAGVDVALSRYQKLTDMVKPFEGSYAIMLSNKGMTITSGNGSSINVPYETVNPEIAKRYSIVERIGKGERFSIFGKDAKGKEQYMSFSPIYIGSSTTPWALLVVTPMDVVLAKSRSTLQLLIFIGILGLIILGFVLSIIANRLVDNILLFTDFSKSINAGDLSRSITINREDEIGELARSLEGMKNSLKGMVESIREGSDSIVNASEVLNSSSQQLATDANRQAAIVEEVASSMEEMVANIHSNSLNAKEAEKIVRVAAEGVKKGSEATMQASNSMEQIAARIRVITDIAFQTNLLALNAAVEAARAGEHGRGFSVVAAEVRKLAERSRMAADEIVKLISDGVKTSNAAGESLRNIVAEIDRTVNLVEEISVASVEQAEGSNQINSSIQDINAITQANATSSEEISSNAEMLADQAEKLRGMIDFFKL